jgi:kynurenine formamidase
VLTEHSGTHFDALCHQAWDMEMHGGVRVDPTVQTPSGFTRLGAETVPPIVTRGVLLDAARHAGVERLPRGASVEDLEEVARAQGVEVRRGDAVLVRTGNGALWDDVPAYKAGAGVGLAASRWLAAQAPLVVGADTIAWDVPDARDPELGSVPGHVVLIVQAGIYIVESLYLEEIAADQRWEFAFVCLPLKMRGGTGSPVRPVAIA